MKKIIICIATNLCLASMATADTVQFVLAREESRLLKNAKTLDRINNDFARLQNLRELHGSCQRQLWAKKIPYDCYEYNFAIQHPANFILRHTHIENLPELCRRWAATAHEGDFRAATYIDPRCMAATAERLKIIKYKKMDVTAQAGHHFE